MSEKKVFEEYDPLSGAKTEYYFNPDDGKYFVRCVQEMEAVEKYCHARRQEEGQGTKGFRWRNLIKGKQKVKSFGVLPSWIYWKYKHLSNTPEGWKALKVLFEKKYPQLKTTNSKL